MEPASQSSQGLKLLIWKKSPVLSRAVETVETKQIRHGQAQGGNNGQARGGYNGQAHVLSVLDKGHLDLGFDLILSDASLMFSL